jgi:hypothetical protein
MATNRDIAFSRPLQRLAGSVLTAATLGLWCAFLLSLVR